MADGPVWRTPREGKSEVSLRGETLLPAPSLAWLMCLSQGLSRTIVVFSGAALPAPYPYSILEVGPLGPAGGAAEGPELGYGAPGATCGSTAGLDVLDHVTPYPRTGWDRSWSPRSRPVHHTHFTNESPPRPPKGKFPDLLPPPPSTQNS